MLDLRKEISLGVTEEFEKVVMAREQVTITLEEAIANSRELDENKAYILKEGALIHVRNDGFRLFFYKGFSDIYSSVYLYELVNASKKDAKYSSSIAYQVIGKTYQDYKQDLENQENIKKSNKIENKKEELYCWECGSLLDINNNCKVCGSSKEIYGF